MSLGLSNWNFKSQTPTQENQFRPFQESGVKFQTQKVFERKFTDEPRSFMRAEVPSFDTLEKSIRGFSSSRIKDDLNLQKIRAPSKTTLYSPKKLSGIKQKYSTETNTRIGTIGTGTNNNSLMFSRPSVSNINNNNISNRTSARLSTPSRLESSFSKMGNNNNSTSGLLNYLDNERYLTRGGRNLSEVVPISNLVDIRTKLEAANSQTLQQLSPAYVSELVRLAQVITASVKRRI